MYGNKKKIIYLFLALLLPVFVFLFLKFFGKNEFAVQPLFQGAAPEAQPGCYPITIPYRITDSVMHQLNFGGDSLMLIWFGKLKEEGETQARRVSAAFGNDPLQHVIIAAEDMKNQRRRKCTYLLKDPYDVVLIDRKGLIRGQFVSDNREEIDRLMTEVDIILKKY